MQSEMNISISKRKLSFPEMNFYWNRKDNLKPGDEKLTEEITPPPSPKREQNGFTLKDLEKIFRNKMDDDLIIERLPLRFTHDLPYLCSLASNEVKEERKKEIEELEKKHDVLVKERDRKWNKVFGWEEFS